MVASSLRKLTDTAFPPIKGIYVGGRPHTQTLDIADGLRMVVEKSLDDKSRAALADFDVAAFYDEHSLIRVFDWMRARSYPIDIAVATIRIHLFPAVRLKCGQHQVIVAKRSRGSLTGSRSANEIGRIPVQQSIEDSLPFVQKLGYPCDNSFLFAATFVDNIFVAAACASFAIKICETIASFLRSRWDHRIKPDSQHIMPIDPSDTPSADGWTYVSVLDCLGHFIAADGTIRSPLSRTRKLVWKSFFSKFQRHTTKHLDDEMLAAEVSRHLLPVVMYRASGWSYQKQAAIDLDILQAKLVGAATAVPRQLHEADDEYHKRRCRVANHLCEGIGRWPLVWAYRVVAWYEHVKRNTSGTMWSGLLSDTRNGMWLQARRSLFAPKNPQSAGAWSAFAGRTDTRLKRGSPPVRYESGVQYAREVIETRRQAVLVAPILRRLDQKHTKFPHNRGTNSVILQHFSEPRLR